MIFNWCYFPLETDGQPDGVQNPLPGFVAQSGDPWAAGNSWFNGDGSATSLVTPWSTDTTSFDNVALPRNGSYLIGFQLELGNTPSTNETILFCGYSSAGNTDGLRIDYQTTGKVRLSLHDRSSASIVRDSKDALNNRIVNVFCYIDHRPAGVGVDIAYVHTYTDGTDMKSTSSHSSLHNLSEIYPQAIETAAALMVGAMQVDGAAQTGTHYSGKIRRLHIINFGPQSDDVIANLAEVMGELSKANMIPTPDVQQIAGFPAQTASRSFVEYVRG